ncbi:hypothetical protein MATL_G00121560 [Megalops atlanticus]|uniref:Neurogenic mastermind-like N-terminal domain-containing protein n=1 Tax=Megalops atlanticus TaxID=7932 RepID=A0A9D3PXT2_MEGAT|nr:hypothetical protein MATL_G00121560 [Megalops atlanticus]
MGDTALPQPTAGGFVPMLGVGMVGSMPGAVSGPVPAPRVPQLHNAIVERLRARIELCRRHHSTCESRYQRGQAESSDREHESTLHLLNIVHQGPGNRKNKGNRTTAQPPPEYNNRVNGEQKSQNSAEGESKHNTRIALQGSLRRKIEGHPQGYNPKQNGLSGREFGSDFKRLRMEGGSLGHSGCVFSNGQSHALPGAIPTSHGLQSKNSNAMTQGVQSDLFTLTLKEMKKEPGEVHSCGQSSSDPSMMVFDFKDEGSGQLDPELQDLFDELTNSVPSLNDLEFEKMLKQDDTFDLDLGRPNSVGASKPCPQLEKVIKSEYSPSFCQTSGSLSQLRPASAGPAFSGATMSLSSSSVANTPKNSSHGPQGSSGAPRTLSTWHELSHAEQLKQMAANQQPGALLHHHQPNQPGTAATWSPAMTTHSSPGSFGQEKIPTPASILPTISGSQTKGMNSCLFKPNGQIDPNHMDLNTLCTKPMLHFIPKTHSVGQQIPMMAGPQSKPAVQQQQQQQSTAGQSQPRTPPRFPNPQLPVPVSSCLQPKSLPHSMPSNPHGPGLHFTLAQQRQPLPPGPHPSTGSSFVGLPAQGQSQQHPAPGSHQKTTGNNHTMHRQQGPPQQIINDSDKMSTQDQLSRHLTRPPPDYKQPRRNVAGLQHANLYTGGGLHQCMSSSQPLTTSDKRFVSSPDTQHEGYVQTGVNQLQQHCNPNQIGLNQNKPRFSGPNNQGNTFGSNTQHIRPTVSQEAARILGQRLGTIVTDASMVAPTNWAQGPKQTTALDTRRFSSALPSQQATHHFSQRPMTSPNQVAPDIGMLPPGQTINGQTVGALRESAPRLSQSRMPPLPAVTSVNQASPLQTVPASNFSSAGHNPRTYQSSGSGHLTFDFLQEGDNMVPGINTDSDFIDSLLKSGSTNDDWMKDINLDEILGSQS